VLIKFRKRFLEAHKNQLDELLCSQVYHKQLFGGFFILQMIKHSEFRFHIP
jgi:hypothetical protein